MGICHQISKETRSQKEKKMSDWVVLDISAITKTTNREKVLKILKAGGMTVCKVTDPYMSEKKNKNVITITVKRADYESKNPEYPGSWIIEEDYASVAEICDPLETYFLRQPATQKTSNNNT